VQKQPIEEILPTAEEEYEQDQVKKRASSTASLNSQVM